MIKITNKRFKKLSTPIIGLVALASSTVACSGPNDKVLENSSLGKLFTQLSNNNNQTQRKLKLNSNFQFDAILEGTKKGNGTLKVHNLNLRVFDQHDDGIVYEGDLLKIDFKDLNNDTINEIIITGILKYTGNTKSDPTSYSPFTQIFSFNCKTGLFISLYKTAGYSIELPTANVNPVMCPAPPFQE